MQIIKIDYKNPPPQIIRKVARILKRGGLVVVPTETVYGILGDGLSEKTVKKLLRLKKRDRDKGFDLTLYPLEKIFKYAKQTSLTAEVLKRFSEQPLSLAFQREEPLPAFLNPGYKTVAFHFFFSKIDEGLFKYINTPLIGTSANISRLPDTHSVEEIAEYFRHTFGSLFEPDLILDAGELPMRKPSAIIELTGRDIKLIREGDVSKEIMEKEFKKIKGQLDSREI